jgi:hypothetical protein
MKRSIAALALAVSTCAAWAQASPVGMWRTIDDDGKTERSLVRISETGGVLSGRRVIPIRANTTTLGTSTCVT